ncbi:carbamoyltransferase HypF [Adlercreutzia aquisgranensis]|uniref:carbamoyltransferase HypF n=1 Tax=Adlercreutzia aquisgranensis TaxID=2941323 RepID=UPI00203F8356|nr:carbamoyltransferase HypF [Adlercreutzia aquisgranensis]
MIEALDIHVKGIVQGVGFRPFVYRLAKKYLVNGWVLNAVDGVHIHAEAESGLLDEFVMELSQNPPAASQVREIDLKEVPLQDFGSFEIRFSEDEQVQETTLVSPELATCDDCVRELFDPADRRFRYPFINCTNCGPRFTIIDGLPYDRAATSMKDFPMCPACAAEYADPSDRRFHAQPDACFACGPALDWREHRADGGLSAEGSVPRGGDGPLAGEPALADGEGLLAGELVVPAGAWGPVEAPLTPVVRGENRQISDEILARAVELLADGAVVAVKGLGGFHLACDACNSQAVALLRGRKRREGKAFAVMMASVDDVRKVCFVSDAEAEVLRSPARPIVLLRKRPDANLVPGLADHLPELGVMLPATPVQHLLICDFAAARAKASAGMGTGAGACEDAGGIAGALPPMLVMTSGNIHDEPICKNDGDAWTQLACVADGFLGNNREVLTRFDDSVVRVLRFGEGDDAVEALQFIRRARGYAPLPLALGEERAGDGSSRSAACDPLLAVGSQQKNTFALVRPGQAFVSQHIGDLENADTFDAWLEAKNRYERLFDIAPKRLACDSHPEYLATKWAKEQGLPLTQVQHHHAHVASVLGEHGIDEAVCGFAFDGTGFGVDGAIWGGEVLLANRRDFERFANFAYVPMPGGAACVKHPLRMAYGALWAFDLLEHPGAAAALEALGEQAALCDKMIENGLNTPMTSSVGRLFDAASALLGLCAQPAYEGEPAILLDAAAAACATDERERAYAIDVVKNTATAESTAHDTSVLLLDAAPAFRALLDDAAAGEPVQAVALRFQWAFVQAVSTAAQLVQGLYGISTVALSGGVFMNRFLVERCVEQLQLLGFTVAINQDLPPNDGCVSFGQAVVAWAAETEDATD